jgi:uncharacterized C2H2 Zn-finger protein
VPFQSSTLTRILQPYLSPGSCTLLASIPEPPTATDETHRSLTYGLDPVITMWMAPAPVQKVPGHHRVVASPASPAADTIFKEVKEQECPLCQAVYTQRKSLNRHIRLDHWTTCHLCFPTYKEAKAKRRKIGNPIPQIKFFASVSLFLLWKGIIFLVIFCHILWLGNFSSFPTVNFLFYYFQSKIMLYRVVIFF